MCSLPLPTKPKFADDDTARYESKKGEKAKDVPLNPVVRYFMPNIVEITCLRNGMRGRILGDEEVGMFQIQWKEV